MENWIIRKIEKKDNPEVASLIRAVFDEMNISKFGTAYEDPYLDLMYEEYNKPKSVYFVVEKEGKIIGSAGIAPLENEKDYHNIYVCYASWGSCICTIVSKRWSIFILWIRLPTKPRSCIFGL